MEAFTNNIPIEYKTLTVTIQVPVWQYNKYENGEVIILNIQKPKNLLKESTNGN